MQIIVKHCYNVGWGGTTGWESINGGDFAIASTFGPNSVRIPVSCDGVFSDLSILPNPAIANPTFTVALAKNGLATALAVSPVASALTPTTNSTDAVSVVAGDDVSFIITGAHDSSPSGDYGISVAFTPTNLKNSTYGIVEVGGTINNGFHYAGGAFGNGVFQTGLASGGDVSNTYSISCLAGTITRLDLKSFRGAIGVGNTFTTAVRKNGIIQDGTAGTIDTRVTLTGANTAGSGAISFPVAIGDLIDLYLGYSGTDLTYDIDGVAVSCCFEADAANVSQWCGGNNDALGPTDSWHWMRSDQNGTSETNAASVVGPNGLTVTGLYVRHDSAALIGVGESYTDTLRVNGADTVLSIAIAGPQVTAQPTGLLLADVAILADQRIDMLVSPAGTPPGTQFHWGLSLLASKTATLYVTKIVNSADPIARALSFAFTTTGGLSPSTFNLLHGETQVYAGIDTGTYGIAETVPPGFDVTYAVSNGSPVNAIVLGANEAVVVTVTNMPCTTAPAEAGCWGTDDDVPPKMGAVSHTQPTAEAGAWGGAFDVGVLEVGLINPEGSR